MLTRRTLLAALCVTTLPGTPLRAEPSHADLADDVAILRQALALHPGVTRYLTPARLDANLARFAREWMAAPTLDTRYLALSRFLATLRCGHSYANFFNQKKRVAAALFDRRSRLPFTFRWIGREMVVLADQSGGGLARGTRVVAINGIRPADMLDRLIAYTRADGHNDAKRVSLLEMHGEDGIEYFDVFHGLLYGEPAGGIHRLETVAPDGRQRRRAVPAFNLAERRQRMTVPDKRGDGPVWTWDVGPDGIALLTMPMWDLYDSKWDWRTWLDDRLDSLRGAKGLVIDLRANEGGQDCGNLILARLTKRDVQLPGAQRKVRFRTTPQALDPYLDTWDDSFRALGVGAADMGDGFFLLPPEDDVTAIAANGTRVACPIATLVGPVNSSATFQFAQVAKETGLSRLFGSPTGGNRRGINGGCFFFVRLPASGIEFDLPLIGTFRTRPEPDAGLLPDFQVGPTIADIAMGIDREMIAARAWIVRA